MWEETKGKRKREVEVYEKRFALANGGEKKLEAAVGFSGTVR